MATEPVSSSLAESFVSAKQLSEILGVHVSYIGKLGPVFSPIRSSGRTKRVYKLGESIQCYLSHLREMLTGSPQEKEFQHERILKLRLDRQFKENLLAQQQGDLHPSKLIFELYADRIRACRDTALALPNKIAQIVSDETSVAANFKLLTQEMEELLLKLAAPRTEEVMANVGKYIPVGADLET
jgi:hypothetical protein